MFRLKATEKARFSCDAAHLFNIIANVESWSSWWPPNYKFDQIYAVPDRTGSVIRVIPPRAKPYYCELVRTTPFSEIRINFLHGPVHGTGVWRFTPNMTDIVVSYDVDIVRFPPAWADLRGGGRKRHTHFMNQLFRGLAHHGNCWIVG